MKHDEFENQMFNHVNENCKMKELDRQEVERAARREYLLVKKRKRIDAVLKMIAFTLCFATLMLAVIVLNSLGYIPSLIAIIAMAVTGYVIGLNVNSLFNRIKK